MGDKGGLFTSSGSGGGRKKSVADMLSMWEQVNANTNERVRYHKLKHKLT